MTVRWLAESHEDGLVVGRVGRDGDDLVAEWPGRATLRSDARGGHVRFFKAPELVADDAEKLERGSVQLLLLHLRGGIPLHGAAVAMGEHAVVLVGESGAGKSTLAASLCVHQEGRLLADDAVLIDRGIAGFCVRPNHERSWLDGEGSAALGLPAFGDAKLPLVQIPRAAVSAALRAIVFLRYTDVPDVPDAQLAPLYGLEAVGALLPQLTRFVVDDPAVARRDLDNLEALVSSAPVFCLERPRGLQRLSETSTLLTRLFL